MAYYFACTALPPISIGVKPEMSFNDVREMLRLNLSQKDLRQVELLVREIDLYNLRALWLGIPVDEWDDKGNYSPKGIEEALLITELLPEYLIDFLQKHESTEERLRYFPALFSSLYREESYEGFLKDYFSLERKIWLILTALRSKAFGRDIVRELQFEDPQDSIVAEILAQKDMQEFSPPREFEELKTLFMENISDPQKLNRAILQYRFSKIEELEERSVFSLDQILGYLARLIIVEDWQELNWEKGQAILEKLIENG